MSRHLTANESSIQDYNDKRKGAIEPSALAHNATVAAWAIEFPNSNLTLNDLLGKKALESLLSDERAVSYRREVSDEIYNAQKEMAYLIMLRASTPSAIASALCDLRHAMKLSLAKLQQQDKSLSHLSEDDLITMAGKIQDAVEESLKSQGINVDQQGAGTRLARLVGSAQNATAAPHRR